MCLAKEYEQSKVRVNTVCIHFGVAPPGVANNQFGMPASSTNDLGVAFTKLAVNQVRSCVRRYPLCAPRCRWGVGSCTNSWNWQQRGQTVCLAKIEDVAALPAH